MLNNIKSMWQVMRDIKLSRDKKEELVKKRLKRVLISAYKHVPYYSDMMNNLGYNPITDYKGPKDLKIFPITTKKDIKSNDTKMFLKKGINTKNLYYDCTSGSTGIPLKVFFSPKEKAYLTAIWLRMLFLNGYSLRDKYFTLTAPTHPDANISAIQKLGFFRKKSIVYPKSPKKTVDILLNYQPQVIYGTRSYLDMVANELIKRKIRPKDLKLVISGEEVITENHRQMYKEAFGIEVIDVYGTAETTMIAYETLERDGMHICEDSVFLEFLDKNNEKIKNGETGRIVVTSLINEIMPFIRYDLGDLATISISLNNEGKFVKRILKITGRENDNFALPDGTRIYYHDFYNIIFKHKQIIQFQAIQKTKTHVRIIIAASIDYFNEILPDIEKEVSGILSNNWTFEILRVDFIKPNTAGKLSMLVSEVED